MRARRSEDCRVIRSGRNDQIRQKFAERGPHRFALAFSVPLSFFCTRSASRLRRWSKKATQLLPTEFVAHVFSSGDKNRPKKRQMKSVQSARVRTFLPCVRISVIQAAPRGGSNAVAAQKCWKRDLASTAQTRPVRPGSRTALPHRPPDRVVPGPQRGRRLSLRLGNEPTVMREELRSDRQVHQ